MTLTGDAGAGDAAAPSEAEPALGRGAASVFFLLRDVTAGTEVFRSRPKTRMGKAFRRGKRSARAPAGPKTRGRASLPIFSGTTAASGRGLSWRGKAVLRALNRG